MSSDNEVIQVSDSHSCLGRKNFTISKIINNACEMPQDVKT